MEKTAEKTTVEQSFMKASEVKGQSLKSFFKKAEITKINRKKGEGPPVFVKKFMNLTDNNKMAVVMDKKNKKRQVRLATIESFEGNFANVV